MLNTNKFDVGGSRERVLSDGELRSLWTATGGDDQYSQILRLLLLTGCRRDEIGSVRWSEVDLEKALISLPGERTKNSRAFDVPLAPAALSILEAQPRKPDRDFVFGRGRGGYRGWARSKATLDSRVKIEPRWTLHDLRRTLSTVMHERLGVQPHVVEAVLGHVSGHKAGVAGVYNRAAYLAEKTVALLRWAEHIAAIVEGHPAKIVALRS